MKYRRRVWETPEEPNLTLQNNDTAVPVQNSHLDDGSTLVRIISCLDKNDKRKKKKKAFKEKRNHKPRNTKMTHQL